MSCNLSRGLLAGACLALSAPALAGTFEVLHMFKGGKDGAMPLSDVALDAEGDIYGMTFGGGPSNFGTVFKISADGHETILHAFTGDGDGSEPQAGLTLGPDGALYGTTRSGGGGSNAGIIYRITPHGDQTVLHVFDRGVEGDGSVGNLTLDKDENIFGINAFGGSEDCGAVYKFSAQGTMTVLHSFHNSKHDGCGPNSKLWLDQSGNLYGTTGAGGPKGLGTVFEIPADGKERVLFGFGSADRPHPHGGLARNKRGDLYGTTQGEGDDLGTVFKLSPDGVKTVLHSFAGVETGDGARPLAGVVFGPKGKLYGMTPGGGTGSGVVFQLRSGRETLLHDFDGRKGGAYPQAGLAIDAAGNLYGTTVAGGYSRGECSDVEGCGTVFRLTP